ncbi:MAG TPA: hypothetical protein PKY50_17400 [Candidatus Competibacter sp.]|nr:hypothetical protein [Candidatus Competibacter sp.]
MKLATPDKVENALRSIRLDQAELSQLNEKYRCASEEAENLKRAVYQLDEEILMVRGHIEALKKRGINPNTNDLEKLIEDRDHLSARITRATDEQKQINLELTANKSKTNLPRFEKEDVLLVQKAMDEKRAALTRVDAAIEVERAKADTAFSMAESSTTIALQTRLENLLADAIYGPAQSDEIEEIRAKFIKSKAATEREREAASELARHTIAGLERKRQQLRAELDQLIDDHRISVWLYLQNRMADRRAVYLEAGRTLAQAFAQMRAFELLSRNLAGKGMKAIRAFSGDISAFELPEPHGVREPALRITHAVLDAVLKSIRAEFDPIRLDF